MISNITETLQSINVKSLTEYRNLEELHLYTNQESKTTQLEMIMSSDEEIRPRIKLCFSGVSRLQFRDFALDGTRILGLEIQDYSSAGWEGVRFKVEDFEEQKVLFYCSRVNAQVMEDE